MLYPLSYEGADGRLPRRSDSGASADREYVSHYSREASWANWGYQDGATSAGGHGGARRLWLRRFDRWCADRDGGDRAASPRHRPAAAAHGRPRARSDRRREPAAQPAGVGGGGARATGGSRAERCRADPANGGVARERGGLHLWRCPRTAVRAREHGDHPIRRDDDATPHRARRRVQRPHRGARRRPARRTQPALRSDRRRGTAGVDRRRRGPGHGRHPRVGRHRHVPGRSHAVHRPCAACVVRQRDGRRGPAPRHRPHVPGSHRRRHAAARRHPDRRPVAATRSALRPARCRSKPPITPAHRPKGQWDESIPQPSARSPPPLPVPLPQVPLSAEPHRRCRPGRRDSRSRCRGTLPTGPPHADAPVTTSTLPIPSAPLHSHRQPSLPSRRRRRSATTRSDDTGGTRRK